MRDIFLLFISIMIFSVSYGQEDLSIEQKESIIKYSFDNYKSINIALDISDNLKAKSQLPLTLENKIDKNELASNFINSLSIDNVRGNEIILTSELTDFPNVSDIVFLIQYKSVLDSDGKEILDMTSNKMERESKSSSDYKPYINGVPGFMTNIYITQTDKDISVITGEISIKIPVSYDTVELDLSKLNETKSLNGNSFKLLVLKDNLIVLEINESQSNYKLLPLNIDGKEYAQITEKTIPLSLYEIFKNDSELSDLEIKDIAGRIKIKNSEKVLVIQVSGKANKVLIYSIMNYEIIDIPIVLRK